VHALSRFSLYVYALKPFWKPITMCLGCPYGLGGRRVPDFNKKIKKKNGWSDWKTE
jgi:hypothetical protein